MANIFIMILSNNSDCEQFEPKNTPLAHSVLDEAIIQLTKPITANYGTRDIFEPNPENL